MVIIRIGITRPSKGTMLLALISEKQSSDMGVNVSMRDGEEELIQALSLDGEVRCQKEYVT